MKDIMNMKVDITPLRKWYVWVPLLIIMITCMGVFPAYVLTVGTADDVRSSNRVIHTLHIDCGDDQHDGWIVTDKGGSPHLYSLPTECQEACRLTDLTHREGTLALVFDGKNCTIY